MFWHGLLLSKNTRDLIGSVCLCGRATCMPLSSAAVALICIDLKYSRILVRVAVNSCVNYLMYRYYVHYLLSSEFFVTVHGEIGHRTVLFVVIPKLVEIMKRYLAFENTASSMILNL